MSGVGMYEPRPVLLHSTCALDDCPAASVMSPAAPGRDREDRPLGRAAAGDDDGVAGEDRRRRGDLRAAAEPPALRAGVRDRSRG